MRTISLKSNLHCIIRVWILIFRILYINLISIVTIRISSCLPVYHLYSWVKFFFDDTLFLFRYEAFTVKSVGELASKIAQSQSVCTIRNTNSFPFSIFEDFKRFCWTIRGFQAIHAIFRIFLPILIIKDKNSAATFLDSSFFFIFGFRFIFENIAPVIKKVYTISRYFFSICLESPITIVGFVSIIIVVVIFKIMHNIDVLVNPLRHFLRLQYKFGSVIVISILLTILSIVNPWIIIIICLNRFICRNP